MFGLGVPELIVIFVVALIVFGPKKLPELGKSIGRAMSEFKKASQEFQDSMHAEMREVKKSVDLDAIKKSVDLDELKKLGKIELPNVNKPGEAKTSGQPGAEQKPDQKKNEENKGNA